MNILGKSISFSNNDSNVTRTYYKDQPNISELPSGTLVGANTNIIKTQVYTGSFAGVSTSTDVAFNEMFPTLNLNDVICFNVEITDVYATWDRTFANIKARDGELQIRSYAQTQNIDVRVTAFYK